MLFGAALSQAQVFSIYHRAYDANSGGAGVTFVRAPTTVNIQKLPSGLVGYWPLDGDGKDVSGNKLSGKPINAASPCCSPPTANSRNSIKSGSPASGSP